MNESSWEALRRAQKKKIHFIILVSLPFTIIFSVLLINNRDLLSGTKKKYDSEIEPNIQSKTIDEKKLSGFSRSLKTVGEDTFSENRSLEHDSENAVSIKGSIYSESENKKTSCRLDSPISFIDYAPFDSTKLISEELPPITCSLLCRKDLVVVLIIELFFNDEENRTKIRLAREDIKVIIMRSLRTLELSRIRTPFLEKHLLSHINSIFDHDDVVVLKIKNISVEKVVQ